MADDIDGISVFGIVDKNIDKNNYNGVPILGNDDLIISNKDIFSNYPLVITLDDTKLRKYLYEIYHLAGFSFISLIGKNTSISPSSRIGNGVIIQNGVNISARSQVSNQVKLNVNANIMHDCIIEEFCTVAPNAVTLGYVRMGHCSFLGANSTILPRVSVGQNVVIGAGAVVTLDLDGGKTYVGNPARQIKK